MRIRNRTDRRSLAVLVVLALGLCLPVDGAALAKKKWSQATTRTFVVTGDGGERDTRRIARHLVTIHGVFQAAFPNLVQDRGVRTPVLGVRGAKGLRPFLGDRAKLVAGALRSGPLRRDILIRTDLLGQQALTTVYHEYVHLVLRQNAPSMPVWLNEGLAEVWEDLDVSNPERARVGRPIGTHLDLMRNKRLFPLPELLRADHLSEIYQRDGLQDRFYAQSWALTHYLMMAEERKHAAALERYVALVGTGSDPVEAAERLFGDLEELERKLWSYVRALTIPYLILSIPPVSEEEIEVRRLSEAETLAAVGDFLYFSAERESALEMFAQGLESVPTLALAHQGLGLRALARGENETAAERFERALESDPGLWLSHYGRAIALGRGVAAEGANSVEEEHLLRAIELNPSASPAFCRLGALFGRKAATRQAGLKMIRRAMAIEPEAIQYRLSEVKLLESTGSEEAAAEALDRLLADVRASGNDSLNNDVCWYGALFGVSSRVLPACDLACSLDPESSHARDSRGLARAVAGDIQGAVEDFRFVLRSHVKRTEEFENERTEWLRELEAGRNPFDPETLEQIRQRRPPWGC